MACQPRDRAARKNRAARTGTAVAAASDPDPSAAGPAASEDAAPWGRATVDELEDAYAAALARLAQRLEMENAELRAEMEDAKLSASESDWQCQMLPRKEKIDSKRLELWERQKAKLQEEIAECKTKITQVDRELAEVNKAIKNMENKIREDARATEENLALAAEHERAKRESAKANADPRLE